MFELKRVLRITKVFDTEKPLSKLDLASETFNIAQERDSLHYSSISGADFQTFQKFHVSDYLYLQQSALTTLDVLANRINLRVHEIILYETWILKRKLLDAPCGTQITC